MIGKKLTPFKFWCQKVLPTAYDDSLSYYEYLCKLNEYLNEVIEQINTLTEAEENFQEDLSQQWEDYKTGLNDEWLEYKTGLTEEWNTYQRELTEAWLETKGYIDHYFDNLDVQTEINNKLDTMVLNGTMSALIEGVISDDIPTTVTAWLTEHVDPVGSAVVVDNTLTISGAAADAKATGDAINNVDVRSQFSNLFDLNDYLLAKDAYFNGTTHTVTNLNGFSCYKIPLTSGQIFSIYNPNGLCDNGFSSANRMCLELSDGTYTRDDSVLLTSVYGYYCKAPANSAYLYISLFTSSVSGAIYNKNLVFPQLNDSRYINATKVVSVIEDISTQNVIYMRDNLRLVQIGTDAYVNILHLNAGDKVYYEEALPSGFNFYATFDNNNGTCTLVTSRLFTAPTDGTYYGFNLIANPVKVIYMPINSSMLDYKNIINSPIIERYYNGLKGVAFGTSLTYRSQTSWGYLSYLETLSGITFDNQGIGSSKIKGNLLTAIKNYTDYADKDVCILEGFVNDWYHEANYLGTYTDTTESTVCGCVRSALNYILSQNPNLTVFLILDHYGKNGSVDNSSTAVNSAGKTQYEWWTEIGKVAESLGIPVIKEFAISQISENTPQYLADNIHVNNLGAEQSGYAIWSQMKQYFPNRK